MAKSIIPVGFSLGFESDEPKDVGTFLIMVGKEMEEVDTVSWYTWMAAHDDSVPYGDITRRSLVPMVRAELTKVTNDQIIEAIDKLFSIGAFYEIDIENGDLEAFFSKVHMIPTAQCFGRSPDDKDMFRLTIDAGDTWMDVDGWTQAIWFGSHLDGSIWEVCKDMASGETKKTPYEVAQHFIPTMFDMLNNTYGFLEPIDG
ncbi:hypothetical protein [Haloglycomyces albus]|uniref:hypothetical protein n=1 Tax=Haloglycomyces albus TaxID=526067 RepID=UPI00046CB4B7|nr:hypothetical protein [Haloglycomyces albus]